jgi:alpha-L-fucosidase 2
VKSVKAKKKAPANVAVTSITLNKTATEITVGQTETLSVTKVLPANATDPTYTWKTSDETKATVDQDGVVTAVAAGNVNIYAEANDGSGVQGTCAVTVTPAFIPVTAITLNMTETLIMVGSTETLSVTAVAPDNATDKTYTWKTSDASIATVDQNGVVTAVAEGTVTIYAEANDGSGVKGNCAVTVIPAFITVTAITLNKTATEIKVGATETLSVTSVLPEEATDKTYTWKTSNASVATVDQDGKVTAVAVGTVTIYAEANDGSGVKGNCEVAVLQPATITVTWNNDDITDTGEHSFFKDGVTITAGMIDFDQKNFVNGGTFTTDPGFGNFTKIEVTTAMWDASGTGWSGGGQSGTWTGNASSVSFDGSIMGMGMGTTTFVFTIELPN